MTDFRLYEATVKLSVSPLRIAGLVAAVAIVAAACGDGADPAQDVASIDSTATTLSAADTELQLLDFAECMREQGIDFPDPTVDASGDVDIALPDDFDPANTGDILEAAGECQEFLEGIAVGFDAIDLTAVTDTLLEFSACMRDNGFDLRDPDFSLIDPASGSIPTGGPFGDVDFDDPDFTAAFEQCEDLIVNLGVEPP